MLSTLSVMSGSLGTPATSRLRRGRVLFAIKLDSTEPHLKAGGGSNGKRILLKFGLRTHVSNPKMARTCGPSSGRERSVFFHHDEIEIASFVT